MTVLALDNWRDFDLDHNVVSLVLELTKLGFTTKSSCGGHGQPIRGQCGLNNWYVAFVAGKSETTSVAELFSILTEAMADGVKLEMVWDGKVSPMCRLEAANMFGASMVTPDQVADVLRARPQRLTELREKYRAARRSEPVAEPILERVST
jgi:hypothetical protein